MVEPIIFVIDDDHGLREATGLLIASAGHAVRLHATAEAFLADYNDGPGCAVADMRLPGMSGLELMRLLGKQGCPLPLILITGHGDVPLAVTALKAGAVDFIEKPYNPELLLQSVDRAIALDRELRAQRAVSDAVHARHALLTDREREVMALIVAGDPNKIVAAKLGISPRTVENHRAQIMVKMGARSLSELVHFSFALGKTKPILAVPSS